MLRPSACRALCVGALLAAGAPAAGAQTTFTDRSTFLSSFLATGSNDLDGVLIPDPPGVTPLVPGLSFGFTIGNLFDPTPDAVFPTSTLGPASLASGQSWSVNDGGVTRVAFLGPVNGFGARFFALGSIDDVVFRFFAGSAELGSAVFPAVTSGLGYDGFFGVAFAAGFDRVDIEAAPAEFYEMDDLAAGAGFAPVPEPSTVALVAFGAGALLVWRRRRAVPARRPTEGTHTEATDA